MTGTQYRAVFTNTQGTATTTAATLTVTVRDSPAITTQPASATVTARRHGDVHGGGFGQPGADGAVAGRAPSGGSTFTNISGATSTTLTVASTTAAQNGNQYRAVFTNSGGSGDDERGHADGQHGAGRSTTQPTSSDGDRAGATATFTAAASGNPTPTVQWQSAPSGSSTFTQRSRGATSTTLTRHRRRRRR